MINTNNILVTSISKKVPLIKAVREASQRTNSIIKIYGADINLSTVGSFFVDEFWMMPRLDELNINELINYCHTNNITSIIPTRDGELIYFSRYYKVLSENGIKVMISPFESVEACLDKYKFYRELTKQNYPVIPTGITVSELKESLSYIVKERLGAGSHSIGLDLKVQDAVTHSETLISPIFQPMIEGTELSVDLYVDKKGNTKGVICRTRDKVVNGESQITSTIRLPDLELLCSNVAETLNLYGHVIFQVIVDKHNQYHIIECNCRFGGASTLSVAAGLDSFYWFLLESMGEDLDNYPFIRNEKELTMVRHPQDYIF